ncbi:MAG: hypothetical protein AAFY36_14585 [Bacteroidota bacterium]
MSKENPLDEFELDGDQNERGVGLRKKGYLVLAGVIFSMGYLALLVNGYYQIVYREFIGAGRHDLVVRLGFLSYSFGMLFYPTSLIALGALLFGKRSGRLKGFLEEYALISSGLIIVGLAFYSSASLDFLFGPKEKWFIGFVLLLGSSMWIIKFSD